MTDNTRAWLLPAVFTFTLGIASCSFTSVITRLDAIEQNAIPGEKRLVVLETNQENLHKSLAELKQELKDNTKEIRSDIKETNNKLDRLLILAKDNVR